MENIFSNKSIFSLNTYNSNCKSYLTSQSKKEKRNSYSLSPKSFSPSQTIYYEITPNNNNNFNKTSYSKFSFDKRLQLTLQNRDKILNKRILNLKNELEIKNEKLKRNKSEINELNKKQFEDNKKLKEIRKVKLKIHNVLKNHQTKICNEFQSKIRFFNMRMLEYFNGKSFLNQQVQFHKHFRFDSGDYEAHSRRKMMTDIEEIKKNCEFEEQLNFKKYFNEEDKKIISIDVNYFIKDENNFNNYSFLKEKTLTQKLNEEEIKRRNKIRIKLVKNKMNKDKNNINKNIIQKERNKERKCLTEENKNKAKKIIEVDNEITKVEETISKVEKDVNEILEENKENKIKDKNKKIDLENQFLSLQKNLSSIYKFKVNKPTIDFKRYLPLHYKRDYLIINNLHHLNKIPKSPNNFTNGINCPKHNKNFSIINFEKGNENEELIKEKKYLINCVNRITDIYKREEINRKLENDLKTFNSKSRNKFKVSNIKNLSYKHFSYDK